jgi:CO/xanthine dehydrogenase Mo-binding subunit
VEVGFDDEGRVLTLRDEFVHDTGACTPRGLAVPLLTAGTMSGPYRIPNVEVSFASVYTNRVPVTPYRGAGQPQAVFVLERVMDLIARKTGRDRAAVRFANFVQPADMPYDADEVRPARTRRSRRAYDLIRGGIEMPAIDVTVRHGRTLDDEQRAVGDTPPPRRYQRVTLNHRSRRSSPRIQ